jgi:3-oxoacyl-[acyl-carrier-protein] synthase II
MNHRRVVVTGLGIVSPIGYGVEENWENITAGKSGIGPITLFDTSGFSVTIAGEVDSFDPTDFIPEKDARRMDRFIQFSMVAGNEAIRNSGLEISEENADLIGVYIGAGIGGVTTIEATTTKFNETGARRISPFYIPMSIVNMAAGNISIYHGLRGPNLAVTTACSTGTHAIGDAARLIQFGDADAMIAGGTEAAITPTSVGGFASAKALSRRNSDPEAASRPWDLGRDGFVMGEGAGVLVLEELEFAKRRGARIYAELTGFGMSGDAYHMTSPAPGGNGAKRCMLSALRNGNINPDEIDYINAHGTSTPQGDIAETLAVKDVFGSRSYDLALSSSKSMVGHLLGAAGGVEAVYTVLSIYNQVAPPTINLDDPDPECDLDYISDGAREMKIRNAISNSFGFGGTNGTVAFRKFN